MATFRTTRGTAIFHCHVGGTAPCDQLPQLTAAQIATASAELAREFPNAVEVRPATYDYNCYGLALTGSHGWFELALDFLNDDHNPRSMSGARGGDLVVYIKSAHTGEEPHEEEGSEMVITNIGHVAVVTRVENGQIAQLISKWGANPAVLHTLTEVPAAYGAPERLYRRVQSPSPAPDGGSILQNGEDMNQDEIRQALQRLAGDAVQFQVMLASTEQMRNEIIASLPEVRALIERAQEASEAVVEFFERDETRSNPAASGAALYIMRHMPSESATRAVARSLKEGTVGALNRKMAAQTFLALRHIEPEEEDPVEFAMREASAFLRGK